MKQCQGRHMQEKKALCHGSCSPVGRTCPVASGHGPVPTAPLLAASATVMCCNGPSPAAGMAPGDAPQHTHWLPVQHNITTVSSAR